LQKRPLGDFDKSCGRLPDNDKKKRAASRNLQPQFEEGIDRSFALLFNQSNQR
jgi:hypothetical protein